MPRKHRPQAWIRRFKIRRAAHRIGHVHTTPRYTPEAALAISAAAIARDHDRLTDAPPFDLARALAAHDQMATFAEAAVANAL